MSVASRIKRQSRTDYFLTFSFSDLNGIFPIIDYVFLFFCLFCFVEKNMYVFFKAKYKKSIVLVLVLIPRGQGDIFK